jgi:hypothetical protein
VKYIIEDADGHSVSLQAQDTDTTMPTVILYLDQKPDTYFVFLLDEFKEFRRAIGYVWQEIEGDKGTTR